jgi:hypothetical protein
MNQTQKILYLLSVLTFININIVIAQDDDQFANTTIDSIQVSDGIYMLIAVKNNMQELMAQGKIIEEIIALNPNAELDKIWGNGFLDPEIFLRVLHSVMPN